MKMMKKRIMIGVLALSAASAASVVYGWDGGAGGNGPALTGKRLAAHGPQPAQEVPVAANR